MRNLFIICLLLASLACLAIPTGLNIMPTADVLPPGASRLDYESSGTGKLNVPAGSSIIGTQNGSLFDVEAGIDNINDVGTVYNLKWRFYYGGEGGMQIAAGAQNLGEDAQYYGVLTRAFGRMKISAGAIIGVGEDNETLGMVGARFDLRPLILMVDHVRGDTIERTAGSVGFAFNNLVLTGTIYDFDGDNTETTVRISYSQSLL